MTAERATVPRPPASARIRRLEAASARWLQAEDAATPSAATRHALQAIHGLLDVLLDVTGSHDDDLLGILVRLDRIEASLGLETVRP